MGERVAFRVKFQQFFNVISCIHEDNCKFKGHKLQASTVNIFGRLIPQFKLPQNFITQNDRGSLALSIEYHLYAESMYHVGNFAVEICQNRAF